MVPDAGVRRTFGKARATPNETAVKATATPAGHQRPDPARSSASAASSTVSTAPARVAVAASAVRPPGEPVCSVTPARPGSRFSGSDQPASTNSPSVRAGSGA